jgi:hypothetical protein
MIECELTSLLCGKRVLLVIFENYYALWSDKLEIDKQEVKLN